MPRNRPLIFTALNSGGQFILGTLGAQKGPAFNDLLLISDTDVEGGSFYVIASNFGFMIGSIITGALYGRIPPKTLMIAVNMTMAGVFTILVPWCRAFAAMIVIQCVVSLFSGALEATITTEEIQSWDGSSQSAMQFLSFCYSLGGVLAPLVTEPFMAPKTSSNNESAVDSFTNISSSLENRIFFLNNESLITAHPSLNRVVCADNVLVNCSNFIEGYSLNNTMINTSVDLHDGNITLSNDVKSNIHFAYLITGALSIALSMAFYVACIASYRKQKQQRGEINVETVSRKLPRKIYVGVVGCMCAYFFFHEVGSGSFNQYLFYFVVNYLNWSKRNAAYLLSMYSALSMCLKLILVVIFRRVDAGIVLLISITGIAISITLLSIAGEFHINVLVWVSTALYALSQAPVFAGGFAWIDKNLVKFDGKITCVITISASLSGMLAPLPLGVLMKQWSLMAFPYFVLFHVSVSASIFYFAMFIVKPALSKKYGPLRPTQSDNVINLQEANEAMIKNESLVNERTINSIEPDPSI